MSVVSFLWDYIIPFLFVLTVLVFVHELGHYLVARYNRVRVEVFSIGFGPEIFGWTDSVDTRWKIGAIPLGGYVKMFGEVDGGEGEDTPVLTPEEKAVSFSHKRLGQRTAIVAAGPIANFLFAMVVLAALFNFVGIPSDYLAGVGEVQPDSAAAESGFKSGDLVIEIDGKKIKYFRELRQMVLVKAGIPMEFVVIREEKHLTLFVVPKAVETEDEEGRKIQVGLLGIRLDPNRVEFERQDPLAATWQAVEAPFLLTKRIFSYLGEMIVGDRDAKGLGGPIRIAQESGNQAKGGAYMFFFFMATLSINLGLINLFPIPMLDGGHLAFYVAEAVRGRPLGPKVQEYSFRFGLILLLLLMIFVTRNDLIQFSAFEFLK